MEVVRQNSAKVGDGRSTCSKSRKYRSYQIYAGSTTSKSNQSLVEGETTQGVLATRKVGYEYTGEHSGERHNKEAK